MNLWRGFTGRLHRPGDARYDRCRLPWRRNVESRPGVVAEAAGPEDVRRAVLAARTAGVPLAVQATGHGALLPCDGGVLLRTDAMRAVAVDPQRRVARVGGGAVWRDVVAAAARAGLAPLSGSAPSVGVTGYTLGGGLGWLSRRHGFAADSLLRADVVTADGRRLIASPDHDEDLWWALRGGGGNFGVVTELELRLFPVSEVFGGVAFYPGDRLTDLLAAYRSHAATEPDDLSTAVVLLRLPDRAGIPEPLRDNTVVAIRACYAGPPADGERLLAPLRYAAGPELLGGFQPMPYAATAALADPQPGPQVSEEHTDLFDTAPDGLLTELDDAIRRDDGPEGGSPVSVVEFRHWGGALTRPRRDGGPAGPASGAYSLIAVAPELGHDTLPVARKHLEELAERLRPYATGGTHLNFLSDPSRTASAYRTADYHRLRRLKRRYDPDNVFSLNHNIPPATLPAAL